MDPQLYERFFEIEDHFWWSVGTRQVFGQVIAPLLRGGSARVVDVGCGTGAMLQAFPPAKLICGTDLSERALVLSRRRVPTPLVRCDATALPFANDSIDLVTALDVVEHLDDDRGCVVEMARICRPGGHVLLHVPAFRVLWSEKDDFNHHRRRYCRRELLDLVTASGLDPAQHFFINVGLFPIALAGSVARRVFRRSSSDSAPNDTRLLDQLYRVPPSLNRLMIRYMALERRLLRAIAVPFGISIVCLARKPGGGS